MFSRDPVVEYIDALDRHLTSVKSHEIVEKIRSPHTPRSWWGETIPVLALAAIAGREHRRLQSKGRYLASLSEADQRAACETMEACYQMRRFAWRRRQRQARRKRGRK